MSVGGGEWNRDLLRQGLEILFVLLWGSKRARPFSPFALQRYNIKVPKVKSLHVCVSFASCICFEVCVHIHPRTVSVVFLPSFRAVFDVFNSRIIVFSCLFCA